MGSDLLTQQSFLPDFDPDQYEKGEILSLGMCGPVKQYNLTLSKPSGLPKSVARKRVNLKKNGAETWTRELILTRLDHPNILKLYHWQYVKNPDGFHHLLLYSELCDQNFKTFLCQNKLELFDTKRLGRQIIAGYEYLYKRNIVHRNIKPENILVNKGFKPCLATLKLGGFARDVPQSAGSSFTLSPCGTEFYISPEMRRALQNNEHVTPNKRPDSPDIFSLGVVIYEMITGRTPFTPKELTLESFTGERKIRTNIKLNDVANVLVSMLQWNPETRPSATKVLEDFTYIHQDIYLACEINAEDVVEILLDKNIDVDSADSDTKSAPLHIAAKKGHITLVRRLLENKCDVNKANGMGNTPLHIAVQEGFVDLVRLLLENKADVNKLNKNDSTALYVACRDEHIEIARLLINHGAELNGAKLGNSTALHVASFKGNVELVKLLLENDAEVNRGASNDDTTPLFVASQNGNVEVVKLPLENKANVNKVNKFGATPLYAASGNGHIDVIKTLLENKAQVNQATTDEGCSPLHVSIHGGNRKVVKLLLNSKAHVNQQQYNGATPLFLAFVAGHLEVAKLLLKNNADVHLGTDTNFTPLSIDEINNPDLLSQLQNKALQAYKRNQETAQSLLKDNIAGQKEVARFILDSYASGNNLPPLHYASQKGNAEVVKFLLENEADANQATSNDKITALYLASCHGHVDVAKCLLENEANVNFANKNGLTPLYIASQEGHVEVVRLLLENKANVNQATTTDVFTPVYIASFNGYIEVVKLLLDYKAEVNTVSRERKTPHWAASINGHDNVANLLKRETNVNKTNNSSIPMLKSSKQSEVLEENVISHSSTFHIDFKVEDKDACSIKQEKRPEVVSFTCVLSGFDPLHYTKGVTVGRGSFGYVKVCHRKLPTEIMQDCQTATLPDDVARKKLFITKEDSREKTSRECKILEQLKHPNILELFFWQIIKNSGNFEHFIMYTELCDQNLKDFLKENSNLKLMDCKVLCNQLIKGCKYLHEQGIIHRDIKPTNILVNKKNFPFEAVLKLGDFGLARPMPTSSCNTQEVTSCGTRKYASPEMFQAMFNGNLTTLVNYSSDIYSLGVVILKMITNKRPCNREQRGKMLFAVPEEIVNDINSPLISKALSAMLKWDPEKRPKANELLDYFSCNSQDLATACEAGNVGLVIVLLKNMVHENQGDFAAAPALYIASAKGYLDVVNLLIYNKAKVNKLNRHGASPLYAACQNGHFEIVKFLFNNGADVSKPTTDGITPLQVASQNGHNNVVMFLKQKR